MSDKDYAKVEKDRVKFINKLKSGAVRVPSYLISNPFSKLDNEDIDGTMTEELFYSDFFSLSYKKYEHIAKILDVAEDANRNTVFITGFRGAGKTTLVNYVKRLIDGYEKLPDLKVDDIAFLSDLELYHRNEVVNFFKKLYVIFKQKNVSNEEIELNNDEQLEERCKILDYVVKQINSYKDYINKKILGKSIYFDFETGTNESASPVEQKLGTYLKNIIKNFMQEGISKQISDIFCVLPNTLDISKLEKKDSLCMKNFFSFVQADVFTYASNYDAIEDSLIEVTKCLKTDQLLSLIVLLEWAYLEHYQKEKRIYFIFDDLDIIFDLSILYNFIQDFGLFLSNMADFLRGVNDDEKLFVSNRSIHSDLCFIFVMRETSQMPIADHFNDRLRNASIHFDISYDVNKNKIVNKRKKFLENILKDTIEEPGGNNTIKSLLAGVKIVNNITSDDNITARVSEMFNYDYKRIVICLTYIYDEYPQQIKEFIQLLEESELVSGHEPKLSVDELKHKRHGVRGILYRLIFNHFKENRHFNRLHIPEKRANQIHYAVTRFILLYLNKIQFYDNDEFMFDGRDKVSLLSLFNDLKNIPQNKEAITSHDMIEEALRGMYELRLAEDWGHLVTFDSLKSTTLDKVLYQIKHNIVGKDSDNLVNIWITYAGRAYVRFMASHFEFYACRFCEKSNPLFSYTNENYNEQTQKYKFEIVLGKVCEVVENFCENMNLFIEQYRVINNYSNNDNDILKVNNFAYFNADKDYVMFHEERYIHQHISYIDSYRMYLIKKEWENNHTKAVDINKRILTIIKRYIDLLSKYEYYGDISKNLHKEFSICYQYIVDKNYDCNDVEISSPSYNNLIEMVIDDE